MSAGICRWCGMDTRTIVGAVLHQDGCRGPVRRAVTPMDPVVDTYLEVAQDLEAQDELEQRARLQGLGGGGGR